VASNFLQQQSRFDKFIDVFNNERPHEALDMKCPAEVYQPSARPYTGWPDIDRGIPSFAGSGPETWVAQRTKDIGNFWPNGFSSGSSTRVSRSKYPNHNP
jgi:hypothetical protein